MLARGANINHKCKKGSTPFFCSAKQEPTALFLLNQLVSRKFPTDQIDQERYNGKTVLRQAVYGGHVEVVKALLDLPGVEERINKVDANRERSPLHMAALMGHEKVVELLLHRGAKVTSDRKGKTPLTLCCDRWILDLKRCREAVCLSLLEADPNLASTESGALFAAASTGSANATQKLIDLGANPSMADDHGWKPIHAARLHGHTAVVEILQHGGRSM